MSREPIRSAAVAGCLLCVQSVVAAEKPPRLHHFSLSLNGTGPVALSVSIRVRSGRATLNASATNDSGTPIHYAEFCVQSSQPQDGCRFTLSTTEVWQPEEKLVWQESGPATKGSDRPEVLVVQLKPQTKLHTIRRLFVDSIEGNNGPMAREQVMALLATSGHFEVTEDRTAADAVVKGRSEVRESATRYSSEEVRKGVALGNASTGPLGAFIAGSARSATQSAAQSEAVLTERLVLRLTMRTGHILWGWDDSTLCVQAKAKFAVDNLIQAAR